MTDTPMTVVETAEFLKHASRLMPDSERETLVTFVGENPEAGEIMAETDGVRKLRWAREGIGKKIAMKKVPKPKSRKVAPRTRKSQTVGESIIEGLEQAIAGTHGENDNVRVTLVHVPEVDVRKVRTKMGLSQAQFATRFGFPPATLRNWEQGRARPDAPTRVLLAVIAKHPEAVEDVLRKAS